MLKRSVLPISLTIGLKLQTSTDISQCTSQRHSPFFTQNTKKLFATTYAANSPIEDRFAYEEENKIRLGLVFDGHGGWQVADYASKTLPSLLLGYFRNATISPTLDDDLFAIFDRIENGYIESIKKSYELGFGEVAKVGSCVVAACHFNNHLVVANSGDCRAVLGSNSTDSKITSTRLTHDHNSREPEEKKKLVEEHPGENDVVVCKNSHACYVKGRLQLTRAFGDLYLKNSEFNQPSKHRGRHIPAPYTPPYVTHKPDIILKELTPQDRFLILASDGVWDYLSDQEAVTIVNEVLVSQKLFENENNTPKKGGEGTGGWIGWMTGSTSKSISQSSPPSPSSEESPLSPSLSALASEALVRAALRKAAEESGISHERLLSLRAGDERRRRHDDTTALVMILQ